MDVGRVVETEGWIRGEVRKSGDTRRDARVRTVKGPSFKVDEEP